MKKLFENAWTAAKGTYEIGKNAYKITDEVLTAFGVCNTTAQMFVKSLFQKPFPAKKKEDEPTEFDNDYPESDEDAVISEFEEKLKETEIPDREPEPEVIKAEEVESNTVTNYSSKSPADRIADWGGYGGAGHPPRTIDDFVESSACNHGFEVVENNQQDKKYDAETDSDIPSEQDDVANAGIDRNTAEEQSVDAPQEDGSSESGSKSDASAEQIVADSTDSDSSTETSNAGAGETDPDSSSSESNESSGGDTDIDSNDGDPGGSHGGIDAGSSSGADYDGGSNSDAAFDMDFDGGGDSGGGDFDGGGSGSGSSDFDADI